MKRIILTMALCIGFIISNAETPIIESKSSEKTNQICVTVWIGAGGMFGGVVVGQWTFCCVETYYSMTCWQQAEIIADGASLFTYAGLNLAPSTVTLGMSNYNTFVNQDEYNISQSGMTDDQIITILQTPAPSSAATNNVSLATSIDPLQAISDTIQGSDSAVVSVTDTTGGAPQDSAMASTQATQIAPATNTAAPIVITANNPYGLSNPVLNAYHHRHLTVQVTEAQELQPDGVPNGVVILPGTYKIDNNGNVTFNVGIVQP